MLPSKLWKPSKLDGVNKSKPEKLILVINTLLCFIFFFKITFGYVLQFKDYI